MTIKAVLFDKDGTLIDFSNTFAPATSLVIEDITGHDPRKITELAEDLQFDMASQTFGKNSVLIAGSLDNIAKAMLPYVNDVDLAGLTQKVGGLYDIHSLASLSPFAELESVIDALENMQLPLGIATNDAEHTAILHMDALGLVRRFTYIAGYDSGFGEKPDPGMVKGFMAHTKVDAKHTMMVGDSLTDCKAGRAAGAVVVAVTSGLADAATLTPHADHVLSGIGELPDLLSRLNGASQ